MKKAGIIILSLAVVCVLIATCNFWPFNRAKTAMMDQYYGLYASWDIMKFAKKTQQVKPGMTEQELADTLGEYYMEDLDIADAEEMSRFDAMGAKLVRIYACNIFTVDVGMENGTVKSIKVENVWKKDRGYSDYVDPEVFWREIYKPGYFSD